MFSRGNAPGKKCLFDSNRKDISCPSGISWITIKLDNVSIVSWNFNIHIWWSFWWTEQDLLLHLPQWTASLSSLEEKVFYRIELFHHKTKRTSQSGSISNRKTHTRAKRKDLFSELKVAVHWGKWRSKSCSVYRKLHQIWMLKFELTIETLSSFIVIHENPLGQEISFRFDSKRHFLPVTFPRLNIIEFSPDVHYEIDCFLKTNILPLGLAPMDSDLKHSSSHHLDTRWALCIQEIKPTHPGVKSQKLSHFGPTFF